MGGNAKTTLVIAVSPAYDNEDETLCSLRFGQRAKLIKNKAHVNKQLTVEECKRIIEELQKELEFKNMRIEQLENFIKKNGLRVPDEEEVIKLLKEREEKEQHGDTDEDQQPLTEDEKILMMEEKRVADQYRTNLEGGEGIQLDDNMLDLLNTDELRDIKDQILNTNNKISDKENQVKKLLEKLDESENFVKILEEKFKNQIKT